MTEDFLALPHRLLLRRPSFVSTPGRYLLADGRMREAYETLETALMLNFEQHVLLFDYFPELREQPGLKKLIEQFRK